MTEILCQDEINALQTAYESLNSTGAGSLSDGRSKEVRLYNFSKPDRVSKDRLKVLNQIHADFAGSLSAMLSGLYQTGIQVDSVGIDQILYSEYMASIPSRTLFVEVSMTPLNANFFIEVNSEIIGSWVDYLCGAPLVLSGKPSNFSSIDLAVSRKMLKTFLDAYAEGWAGFIDLQPEIRRFIDSDSSEDILLPSETVLACAFDIHNGNSTGKITICVPSAGIEALQKILTASPNPRIANIRHDSSSSDSLKSTLSSVSLPGRVVLGKTKISFSDAMNLEIGDVIKTGSKSDLPIEMQVGDNRMFYCRPGIKGGHLSVVISSPAAGKDDADLCDSGS